MLSASRLVRPTSPSRRQRQAGRQLSGMNRCHTAFVGSNAINRRGAFRARHLPSSRRRRRRAASGCALRVGVRAAGRPLGHRVQRPAPSLRGRLRALPRRSSTAHLLGLGRTGAEGPGGRSVELVAVAARHRVCRSADRDRHRRRARHSCRGAVDRAVHRSEPRATCLGPSVGQTATVGFAFA